MKNTSILVVISLILLSCGREKDIDLKLPPFKSEMVVECYLLPGQGYKLSLLESVNYFDVPYPPTIDSAIVTVTHNGITDTLEFSPYRDIITGKFYNYNSAKLVPEDYKSVFSLYVKDRKGRVATAKTIILPPVPIDSVRFELSKIDSMVAPVTYFTDNASTKDYYRYVVYKQDNKNVTDLELDDLTITSTKVQLRGEYNIKQLTPVTISLYHITKEYYDFYKSIVDAREANGNPLAQPSGIKSNILGGMGIFTGTSGETINTTTP